LRTTTSSQKYESGFDDRSSADRWAKFGSESYSREELVAEMGAAFLASEAGIDTEGLSAAAAPVIG